MGQPTIAQQVASVALEFDIVATTFSGGYAVASDGTRRTFPPGKPLVRRENERGRCTLALYRYEDQSGLQFTYGEAIGADIQALSARELDAALAKLKARKTRRGKAG